MGIRMIGNHANNLPLESKRLVIVILTFGTLASLNWINYTYAQEETKVTGTQEYNTTKAGVRITSPTKGEQVPVGELTISGISSDNTTDCKVSVNINDQKPYQNTTATGPGGVNDYSNWTLALIAILPRRLNRE